MKSTAELMRLNDRELFGLSQNYDLATLTHAYRQLSLRYHPDKLTKVRLSANEQELYQKGAYAGAFSFIKNRFDHLAASLEKAERWNIFFASATPAKTSEKEIPKKKFETSEEENNFNKIKQQLLKRPFDFGRFHDQEPLEYIVKEVMKGNFSLDEIKSWNVQKQRFWMEKYTWILIDRLLTVAEIKNFSDGLRQKISTLLISNLLIDQKLTLEEVERMPYNEALNNPYIDLLFKERPDLKDELLRILNFDGFSASPFLISALSEYSSLNDALKDILVESLISNRITLDMLSTFSILELLLIGMECASPDECLNRSDIQRKYFKNIELACLIFTEVYKTGSAKMIAYQSNDKHTPNHYSLAFLWTTSDEHLRFISKFVDLIETYQITPQHLSALSPNEIKVITDELIRINNLDSTIPTHHGTNNCTDANPRDQLLTEGCINQILYPNPKGNNENKEPEPFDKKLSGTDSTVSLQTQLMLQNLTEEQKVFMLSMMLSCLQYNQNPSAATNTAGTTPNPHLNLSVFSNPPASQSDALKETSDASNQITPKSGGSL